MQSTTLDDLLSDTSTWAGLFVGTESAADDTLGYPLRQEGCENAAGVRFVRGKRCRERMRLFQEFAAAWQFPWYFGHNWDALDECLSDLTWLEAPRYVLVVTNIDVVLESSNADFVIFMELLTSNARKWAAPVPPTADWRWTKEPIPFHVIFHTEPEHEMVARRRMNDAGVTPERLRT